MSASMHVSILAAEAEFYKGECISLVVPTVDGQYGIMAGHCEIIAAVVPGELKYTLPDGTEYFAAVSEGLLKIENGEVLILVDTAERPEEIDENRARRAADAAREELLQKKGMIEYRSAQAHLARALSRLRVHGHTH